MNKKIKQIYVQQSKKRRKRMSDKYLHGVEFIEEKGSQPITSVSTSTIGLVGTLKTGLTNPAPQANTPFLVQSLKDTAEWQEGTLLTAVEEIFKQTSATIVCVMVEEGLDETETITNIAGSDLEKTGVFALEKASSVLGLTPKIIAVEGFDGDELIIQNALMVAERLRSVFVVSGPNTTDEEAIAFSGLQSSPRMYIVDPAYIGLNNAGEDAIYSPSPMVAGLIAKNDSENGFWTSPSNKTILNIKGTNRAIGFSLSNPDTSSNYLNEAGVATIIYSQNTKSYKLWGNKTPSSNAEEMFLSVRRTIDTIEDSIELAQEEELDKPITGDTVNQIKLKVQNYLNSLIAKGALLGGTVWVDQDENPVSKLQSGNLVVSFDIEPPAPLERITFKVYRNSGYYEEVFGN